MKLKLRIDVYDMIHFGTFPDVREMEGELYNAAVEYYFKSTINEARFRKIFGDIFSNVWPNFFPA